MRILYVGDTDHTTTSRHRADALGRIGHQVTHLDMWTLGGVSVRHPLWGRIHYRTGYRFVQPQLRKNLRTSLGLAEAKFEVAWVNNGELLGRGAVEELRRVADKVLLYSNDDPTGPRDGPRFASLRGAFGAYDLCAVVRNENVAEFESAGALRTFRVFMGYDEVSHQPLLPEESLPDAFRSEVGFFGTWMPERGPLMVALLRAGLPLAIWGERWHRAPEWQELRAAWRGPGLQGRDYVKAIAGAKVCLGLLSKGNRDLHTTRSSEIPFAGGLLCAERTDEHLAMYRENEDAMFWESSVECISVCRKLLADDRQRERIRLSGMKRVRELHLGNEDVAASILSAVQTL